MSNSFYMDKILNKDNPNEGLIIDFKYPSKAVYRGHPNALYARPKLCFSEHPFCRTIGVPGYDTRFLFYNELPNRLINRNVQSVLDLSNMSHINPNRTDWVVPSMFDMAKPPLINPNLNEFIVPPDLANSPPVHSSLLSKIHPHLSEDSSSLQSNSALGQNQGIFPKWHIISGTYSDQIQNESSAFSELTKDSSENSSVRGDERNGSLNNPNAESSNSNKSSEKTVQNKKTLTESQRNASFIISNADSSTSKKSPERSANSLKMHPAHVTRSSKTIPVQVVNSSKTISNRVNNSSMTPRHVRTEGERFPSISPQQVQDMSSTNPMTREEIFSSWRKHIFDMRAEFPWNNSTIFPETISNIPRSSPVHVQGVFPGWYSPVSSTLGETSITEELPESNGKSKRKRTTFTSVQLLCLERHYLQNGKYLTRLKRIQLAADLGLTEKQIKVWFQNRRVRDKQKNDLNPRTRGKNVNCTDIAIRNERPDTPCNEDEGGIEI